MNDDKVFVERKQFTTYEGKLVAEASDLGIAPGYWPAAMVVDFGNGTTHTFVEHRVSQHLADGPLHTYRNPVTGTELVIYND
jgi:hypothetical protein